MRTKSPFVPPITLYKTLRISGGVKCPLPECAEENALEVTPAMDIQCSACGAEWPQDLWRGKDTTATKNVAMLHKPPWRLGYEELEQARLEALREQHETPTTQVTDAEAAARDAHQQQALDDRKADIDRLKGLGRAATQPPGR